MKEGNVIAIVILTLGWLGIMFWLAARALQHLN